EYNRIVHGDDPELDAEGTVVPDDASSLTGESDDAEVAKIDLAKDEADDAEPEDAAAKDAKKAKDESKTDGDADSK
ncbi:preprotein translocase subunit YajC, partial [Streptomyces sp. SID7499]|nr:preprotein translocase subunit YajC [Streptomyces sp. SID7499]